MRIKITDTNADKIKSAIIAAEGKATVRTLHPCKVKEWTEQTISKLHLTYKVPKKYINGMFEIDVNAQDFSRAYKYVPESTHFTIEVVKGVGYLTDVKRARCTTVLYRKWTLSEETKQYILENLFK